MDPIRIEKTETLLHLKAKGVLKREQVTEVIRLNYPELGRRNVLWDLSEADIAAFTMEDLKQIATVAKKSMKGPHFARVVYIGVAPPLYFKMCLYTAVAAMAETPADYAVFQTETEALDWLRRHSVTVTTQAPFSSRTESPLSPRGTSAS